MARRPPLPQRRVDLSRHRRTRRSPTHRHQERGARAPTGLSRHPSPTIPRRSSYTTSRDLTPSSGDGAALTGPQKRRRPPLQSSRSAPAHQTRHLRPSRPTPPRRRRSPSPASSSAARHLSPAATAVAVVLRDAWDAFRGRWHGQFRPFIRCRHQPTVSKGTRDRGVGAPRLGRAPRAPRIDQLAAARAFRRAPRPTGRALTIARPPRGGPAR